MKKIFILAGVFAVSMAQAQQRMTPELLWKLGRVSAETVTPDGKSVIYGVSYINMDENSSERNLYAIPVNGGQATQLTSTKGGESVVHIDKATGNMVYLHKGQLWQLTGGKGEPKQLTNVDGGLSNVRFSPDGKHLLFSREVHIKDIHSKDKYPDLKKANAYIFNDLNYRHWDTWEDGKFQHVFFAPYENGKVGTAVDIMKGEPHDTPQMPFGGKEDIIWTPDSKAILYVSKKKFGKDYAVSTNTDIYRYDIASGKTINLTEGNNGYDTHPEYNTDGSKLAWLAMDEDGNEADQNELTILDTKSGKKFNLTKDWDETINSFTWSNDGSKIWFVAPTKGTIQLFEIALPKDLGKFSAKSIKQVTKGQFDVNGIVGQSGNNLLVSRTDMNHAPELYRLDTKSGKLTQLTSVNDEVYSKLALSKVEPRVTKATDGKDLFSWVVYPPDFDPNKKYPTLLYCQGGPQSALTQSYSYRWNMQLMAANGYIVVAPNRRGMPGHGDAWNRQISGDWGGQVIKDYLAAIDDVSKEPYVDKDRLGAVGASYGGYSVFMLAGVHDGRFKSFIAHDGLFDMRSWYGTTEELFFANNELKGPYWETKSPTSYKEHNPIEHANKWDTPILIVQGGLDFRVGIEQGLQAFQLAQLKGIKSRLLYLPDENHWVLQPQNAIVWQREFFNWLDETLKKEVN
ncbi:S9 family peptidase [Pontibacter cellulosilyticus]|uniref:S9 family peptidase n=1 Tax=Pontibacter cellulosilyticus TaxID=1720253 RepID=A0A923SHJ0_9BACT|nr:S9 family peptidase [Pontibacter cellulosilyticus]MBC5991794.1 S9 family peptidase [Pontibacter cellulosilyticus]